MRKHCEENCYKRPLSLNKSLTDDKLHCKLVFGRFVGPIEADLHLKLLSAPHDERLAGVQVRVVPLFIDLLRPFENIDIPDIKKL